MRVRVEVAEVQQLGEVDAGAAGHQGLHLRRGRLAQRDPVDPLTRQHAAPGRAAQDLFAVLAQVTPVNGNARIFNTTQMNSGFVCECMAIRFDLYLSAWRLNVWI